MSKLIDLAVGHFSSKVVREIHVPEWDVTLYAKNIGIQEQAKWITRANGNSTEYLVYSVIFGLMDKQGEPVFDIGDKPKLMTSVDPEVISRLANFVLATAAENEEEREKN